MLYLSQLLGKNIYYEGKPFAKLIDLAITENETEPSVAKIIVQKANKRCTIPAHALAVANQIITTQSPETFPIAYEHNDFYLSEDLLDKQVIDIDGRRLVRVNDILLESNGMLKVSGLDVGIGGILRRLGLGSIKVTNKVLPWKVIEAFDYQTGNIRIKLTQNSLNTFHPAELADILESAGTKERLGIVSSLDARQAAQAIEESDEDTQVSILEGLTPHALKEVLNKMHIAEIADVLHDVNPLRLKEMQQILGSEKMQQVKGLLKFPDDVAGGLMHETFFSTDITTTIPEILDHMRALPKIPESIIVTDKESFLGSFASKDLLLIAHSVHINDLITNTKFARPEDDFSDILELFSDYNLRELPVVDAIHKPIGVVLIDELIKMIEEETQKDEGH